MMYEAFQLTLNQVSGSIGQDAMSIELLCVIDVSHRIDKNISQIASIAISIFFSLNDKKTPVHIKHKKPPTFLIVSFDLGQIYEMRNYCKKKKKNYKEQNGLTCFTCILNCEMSFAYKRENVLIQGPLHNC